ncbi:MAG: ornithine cyclodeaminase family protein [Coprothermobacterota bacterium]|nr:ornithine cyclodeaminase family protein [Coprothermobacterota bacterium]
MLLFIRGQEISQILTMTEAIKAVEDGFLSLYQGKVLMPQRTVMNTGINGSTLLTMPVLVESNSPSMAVKVITVYPQNPVLFSLPAIQGLVILYDPEKGKPLAIIDGAALTAIRTGAAGGVAAKYLAREDSKTVTLFGVGAQGETQLEAVCTVCLIKKAFIITNNDPRERPFLEKMKEKLGIELILTGDKKSALEQSDIVITATNSRTPLFDGRWVKPGTHITAIGSYKPDFRELDTETIKRSRIFVDSLDAAKEEAGDLIIPVSEGAITWDSVAGEIGAVIAGEIPGRKSEEEITLFKSVGLAVQDAVVAQEIYRRALKAGLGTKLD